MFRLPLQAAACAACALFVSLPSFAGDDPFADRVVEFDAGSGGIPGYDNPQTTLGSPERFTGEGVFPAVVSVFNPPWGTDEIVSIGTGGFITIAFDTPVTDDPLNPWGIDILIFNNTGFIDSDFPNGIVGGIFSNDGGIVEVSADGNRWFRIDGAAADDLYPTIGYLDSGPYDTTRGSVPSDFTRPVDPSLALDDFLGLGYGDVLDLYDGSGGGAGIDIASTGLGAISYVRVTNLGDEAIEIDAFADVAPIPAPATLAVLLTSLTIPRRRRGGRP